MSQDTYNHSKTMTLLIFLCFAIIGLMMATVISVIIFAIAQVRTGAICSTIVQDVLLFMAPALLVGWVVTRHPLRYTLLTTAPRWKDVMIVLLAFTVSLPAMNYLVHLNEGITLPESLHGFEQWLKQSEQAAKDVTDSLLAVDSLPEMLLMVLMVGVLTGISEELFFRGGLLRPFISEESKPHLAIWIVAIVFSAVHMQFYGFIPRMLLGVWFGYLVYWSHSLWVPIIAHALNNSAVVVCQYLEDNKIISSNIAETIGIPADGEFPWLAFASFIATALVLYLACRTLHRSRS